MSGHSKWATIKRAKETKDAKRGTVFTKLGNNISIAARTGGDPEANFSLRLAVERAKQANMPKENIERAIKRGTGELGGAAIEELTYEGFGPAKAAFIIEAVTDNKNRTASEIRHIFTKFNGSLGATNSVNWKFDHSGVIRVAIDQTKSFNFDELELELIDNGAIDINKEAEGITIITSIPDLQKMKTFLDKKNIAVESAQIEYLAKEVKELSPTDQEKIGPFIDALDENNDVSNFYTDVALG
ncbi:MAG: YebC/PmpR family DNA-binding transcriptional regulator [bacterium]|nr:YebC/PmpR family DNA-binding transcriptional regulator [bacterium]